MSVQKAEERGLGVRQCMRTAPFELENWGPPGLCNAPPQCETKLLRNKRLADVMEALIGILFEAGGMGVATKWMEHYGILPASEPVRSCYLCFLCTALQCFCVDTGHGMPESSCQDRCQLHRAMHEIHESTA